MPGQDSDHTTQPRLSRRGLLSRAHRRIEPLHIDEAEVPFAASASQLLRWLRDRVDAHCQEGGDWRSVIDGMALG